MSAFQFGSAASFPAYTADRIHELHTELVEITEVPEFLPHLVVHGHAIGLGDGER